LAVFPPHATHRLQPLDVSLFRPLATLYIQALDRHTRLSIGLSSLTKRDFLKNFYQAFDKSFTAANIRSGWLKTGIEPFDPEQVLKIFKNEENRQQEAQTPPSRQSSSCLDSPSAIRTIRRIVYEEVAHRDAQSQRTIRKLGSACLTFSAELALVRERQQGLIDTFDNEKRKRKRRKAFTEELRAGEGVSALFFSPSKIVRAKELVAAKETAKDNQALDRLLETQSRAELKAQKELEAQKKRKDRAIRVQARKAEEALKKAQKEHRNEAKDAQKQLETKSRTSSSRPRKKQKTQEESQEPVVTVIEPEAPIAPKQPRSRNGRAIRRPFGSPRWTVVVGVVKDRKAHRQHARHLQYIRKEAPATKAQ